jgi:hypothetical protein
MMRFIWILFVTLAVAAATAAQERERPEPVISLPEGATLQETLAAVQRETGGSVLGEIYALERELETPVNAPLTEALEAISTQMALHVVRRPGSLVFLRRYYDGRELPGLELEEIRGITETAARLVASLAPPAEGPEPIFWKRDFYRSLNAEQRTALQDGGLPFQALAEQQQQRWLRINNYYGYESLERELQHAAQMYRGWDRSRLAWLSRAVQGGGMSTRFYFEFPRAGLNPSPGLVSLPPVAQLLEKELRLSRPALGASSEERPALEERWPVNLRRAAPLVSGEIELAGLLKAATDAGAPEVQAAEHTHGRRLLAYTSGARLEDVLTGLIDLYGWELRPARGTRYTLGRPRPAPAQNAFDLHLKLRALLPPSLHLMWQDESSNLGGRALRFRHHYPAIMAEIDREQGEPWTALKVTELKPETQQRLANLLFDEQCYGTLFSIINRPEPHHWLAFPERGYLRLEGEDTGAGSNPLLRFVVERPDGKADSWGWFIGTNSLGER